MQISQATFEHMFGSVLWSKSTGCSPELYAQIVPPVGLEPTLEGFLSTSELLIPQNQFDIKPVVPMAHHKIHAYLDHHRYRSSLDQ